MSQITEDHQSRLAEQFYGIREHCELDIRQLLICVGFSVCFLYFNYLPLHHSDIRGHVSCGNRIPDHRQLPAEDPFVPLAEGVPVVATAWGSQVLLALTERVGGTEALSRRLCWHVWLPRCCWIESETHSNSPSDDRRCWAHEAQLNSRWTAWISQMRPDTGPF